MSTPAHILLGVSGGIAAYKSVELARTLRLRGHEVQCALTRAATAFVSPLTLEVLTGRAVYQEEYLGPTGSGEELHISAARWADLICIAPATAHVLARLALGLADDFLTTTALAFSGPMVLAPAMHGAMWSKGSTRSHVETLAMRGAQLVGPVEGRLASGEIGIGRMAEPEAIASAIDAALIPADLEGIKALVTAGPTREYFDPVRFLSNRSSGRMGFAIAAELARRGAETTLVAGPVALATPMGVSRHDVTSAEEMRQAVLRCAGGADLVVMTAAVSDFRPARQEPHKLKKQSGVPRLELEETPDILAALRQAVPEALLVGFAAETENLEEHAGAKLASKGADLIVANDVSRSDIGFDSEHNEVVVLRRSGPPLHFERQPKERLARTLIDHLAEELGKRPGRATRRAD